MRTHSNTISEVSDEKLANAFALATVAQANVRSTTMRGVVLRVQEEAAR